MTSGRIQRGEVVIDAQLAQRSLDVDQATVDRDAVLAYLADKVAKWWLPDDVVFVDLRDVRELKREGGIPGAFHCPRGLLEFWIDPESPYHHAVFAEPKEFVFFCNLGWRSALAADIAQQMGLTTCHIDGGFEAWKAFGGEVAPGRK